VKSQFVQIVIKIGDFEFKSFSLSDGSDNIVGFGSNS